MNDRCSDYDFLYMAWVAGCQTSPADAAEAKAALMAHAAGCKICTQAIEAAWVSSKPLPEVDHV